MFVFRHRWTGRYEAHLWDNSCRREGQSRKGRQGTKYANFIIVMRRAFLNFEEGVGSNVRRGGVGAQTGSTRSGRD